MARAKRRDGTLQRGRVVAAHVQRLPKATACCTPGFGAVARRLRQVGTAHRPSRQADACNHFLHGAGGEQVAVGNVSQPMAALRFIHVVRGDEKRQPLGGELMDLLPEIAARFGIDAGGRLVEQQQFRPMNEAGRQREPLLPAAGKLAGELVFALCRAQSLDAFAHGLAPILHPVHARHEIEILRDAQVFPEAEPLRHVADLPLDRFAFGDHVVTQDTSAPGIRAQQSAEHADERRLAAAVRTEEAVDLAGGHLRSI